MPTSQRLMLDVFLVDDFA
ncbi:hypothetical protein PUN32_13455 [Vibrio sp. dsl-7]|uniref:Uncharacterized protein n=1 Tax=Vibrio chanodichtyis TaxID=3027932 RepID=A0ABT5V2W7_9VIBR|nr:hypothetical protein [Vibrio chanodichtyis]